MKKTILTIITVGALQMILSATAAADGGGPMPLCLPNQPCPIKSTATQFNLLLR